MQTARTPRTTLGRYQLVRHLAAGGMADVLLARATGIEGFERHVVLKRIHEEQARDARFVQMFLDEARLAASLHHTNIVQVHDIGQDDGEYFFAMEYIHGEDLRKLLMHVAEREQTVPFEHVITIITAAAAALHHAHEVRGADRKPLGIVHCDVSPANILVAYDGNVKVVDFGIAKATQRTTETQSGLLKGKVSYMSPEQCIGQTIDRRSDIFCLGIVLYELATTRRLFKGANDFLTMTSITHGVVPSPSTLRSDIPATLEGIILKALAQQPEDRFQTAEEMRVALDQFAMAAGLRSSTTALAEYMRELFGERPVPWLADDDEPECELTYDFDGSTSGLVVAPESFDLPPNFVPHSPIVRARTKAITDAPMTLASDRSGGVPPQAATRPSARLTAAPPPPARRRRLYALALAGAVGVVVLGLALALVARGGDAAAEHPAIEADPDPGPKTVKHAPAPVTPPNLIKTEADPEAGSADKPPDKAPIIIAKPKAPPKKPAIPAKKPARGTWDPNALFPKTK